MKLLGRQETITPDVTIKMFEKSDAFGTMAAERDRSISSNCHVLIALLEWRDYPRYGSQIHKAAKFVCESWWNCNGRYKDKWVRFYTYPRTAAVSLLTTLLAFESPLSDYVIGKHDSHGQRA